MNTSFASGLLVWMVFSLSSASLAGETVRITNGEWPPYLSESLKHHGLASRIVTEAFAKAGMTVEYGFFPWARALNEAKIGAWDGSAVWFRSPEREQDFHISEPIVNVQYVFFHLKSEPFDWSGIDDLGGLRIGATLEYNYGEDFQNAEAAGRISVERVPSDEQNFRKLLAGRIDVFPLDIEVGYNMLRLNFTPEQAERFTHHATPVRSEPLYLLLSRKIEANRRRIALFNEGLKALNESGTIERYIEESRRGDYLLPGE